MAKETKTRENWWPNPLAHVRDIDPWADTDVVVAEIQSFDDETCRLEPLANPFGPKVLPMSSE